MSAETPDGAERRAHPRVPTRFDVQCRRLGRGGVGQSVEVVDLSMGGMRVTSPVEQLHSGDVVELTILESARPLVVNGLVVGTSTGSAVSHSHIAFTRVASSTLEQIGDLVDRLAEV